MPNLLVACMYQSSHLCGIAPRRFRFPYYAVCDWGSRARPVAAAWLGRIFSIFVMPPGEDAQWHQISMVQSADAGWRTVFFNAAHTTMLFVWRGVFFFLNFVTVHIMYYDRRLNSCNLLSHLDPYVFTRRTVHYLAAHDVFKVHTSIYY